MRKPTLADHEERIKHLEAAVLALIEDRQDEDTVVQDLSGAVVQTRQAEPGESL